LFYQGSNTVIIIIIIIIIIMHVILINCVGSFMAKHLFKAHPGCCHIHHMINAIVDHLSDSNGRALMMLAPPPCSAQRPRASGGIAAVG